MVKTIEQLREILNRVVNIIDAIAFRESIEFKDYKLLMKAEKCLYRLSYAILTNNKGVLVY